MQWFLALQDFNFSVQHWAGAANGNADGLSRMFAGWSGLVRDNPPPTPKSSERPIIQLASPLATAITAASSTDWRQLSPINSSRGERCKGHNKPQLGEEDPMCTDLSNVCSFLPRKRLRSRPSRQHSHHHSMKKQAIPQDHPHSQNHKEHPRRPGGCHPHCSSPPSLL